MRVSNSGAAVVTAIAERMDFQGSNLRGERVGRALRRSFGTGRASRDTVDAMDAAWNADTLDYVVYSYATPIAWHDTVSGWHVPSDRYSVSTSRHQGVVRRSVPSAVSA